MGLVFAASYPDRILAAQGRNAAICCALASSISAGQRVLRATASGGAGNGGRARREDVRPDPDISSSGEWRRHTNRSRAPGSLFPREWPAITRGGWCGPSRSAWRC